MYKTKPDFLREHKAPAGMYKMKMDFLRKNKNPCGHVQDENGLLVMNWVPVARHGLILWENEATGSRKVSKYLPGIWDAIFLIKMSAEIPKSENPRFFPYILPINRPSGRYVITSLHSGDGGEGCPPVEWGC